ncbi:MAG: MCE family protein [Proteobacteria bacterium]|nr:MCE family protein [Pseudomonadota bacterium]NIS67843.1 MCE family protein [Pseudomonadota bacterium]
MGAVALAIIGVLVFGSGKFFTKRQEYVLFFDGSVKGLNIGAPVMFKGVKIGSVTDIKVVFNPEDLSLWTPVYIQVESGRISTLGEEPRLSGMRELFERLRPKQRVGMFVERGMRAQLQIQSLVTGQLFVAFLFRPETPVKLKGLEKRYIEIPTIPTAMQEMAERIEKLPIEDILNKVLAAVDGIEKVVNSPEVENTVHSLNQTLEDIQKLIRNVDAQVGPLSSSVEKTLRDTQKLVQNANKQVSPLASSIKGTVEDYGKLARNLDSQVEPLASTIEETLGKARTAMEQARKTLAVAETDLGEDSPLLVEFDNALREVGAAARSIRLLADYLKRHPEALLKGKGSSGGK